MYINDSEELIRILQNNKADVSNISHFKSICYSLQNEGFIQIHCIHKYVTGAWFNYCWFDFLTPIDSQDDAYFLISNGLLLALGKLNSDDFQKYEKNIISGNLHTFVIFLSYLEFDELPSLMNSNERCLSGNLLNSEIEEHVKQKIQQGRLISPYIWEWDPRNMGQLLFNWWDD